MEIDDDVQPSAGPNPAAAIRRQAASISLAIVPFGLAFGVACTEGGLNVWEAVGFSTLVFTGSAQFAAVTVLSSGGSTVAAVTAGVLLNLRCVAFGVAMAPALPRPWAKRLLASQLVIDESTAVGTAQATRRWQRYGFLTAGLAVFVLWNLSTLVGATVIGGAGSLITAAGIDATIPAAFLALLWPRLADAGQRLVALLGAGIAVGATPILPAGLPIIVAAAAVLVLRPWKPFVT